MNPSRLIAALLLNLLVLPGAGQAYLKERKRGLMFTVLIVGLLVAFVFHLQLILKQEFESPEMQAAVQNAALSGDPVAKMLSFSKPLTEDVMTKHGGVFRSYLIFIAVIYVASLIDVTMVFLNLKSAGKSTPGG